MSCVDDLEALAAHLRVAADDVRARARAVAATRDVDWVGPASAVFRAAADHVAGLLGHCSASLERAETAVRDHAAVTRHGQSALAQVPAPAVMPAGGGPWAAAR